MDSNSRFHPSETRPTLFTNFRDSTLESLVNHIGTKLQIDEKKRLHQTSPMGGLAFDVEGYDPPLVPIRSAPLFDSSETAAEAAEAYWMALLRETNFDAFDNLHQPDIQAQFPSTASAATLQDALNDLAKYAFFKNRNKALIDPRKFWRAQVPPSWLPESSETYGSESFAGVGVGPYISQFLLRGTQLAEKKEVTPADGIVAFGPQRLSQKIVLGTEKQAYLTNQKDWAQVHGGDASKVGDTALDREPNFIRTLRDGASYVHFDEIYQEYLIAASIILSLIPRPGNTLRPELHETDGTPKPGGGGQFVAESGQSFEYLNVGNPYRDSAAQNGFATFGVTHILTLLAETSTRAHKAGWFHKWRIRRLRPEEFGARVHSERVNNPSPTTGRKPLYTIPHELLYGQGRNANGQLRSVVDLCADTQQGSFLLPQAFSEGCPTHPAYPSGHATVAGASVTILKAMFNEDAEIDTYRLQNGALGISSRPDDPKTLKIGHELNKLASNILFFRGFAGVHWRSDSIAGVLLGELVAIELLVEQTMPSKNGTKFYRETLKNGGSPFFRLTTFKGEAIDIVDGAIRKVKPGRKPVYTFDEFAREHYAEAYA